MNYKYKWKNGAPPSRDEAVTSEHLLDAGQFETEGDRQLAEEEARKMLGVPTQTSDSHSILPRATPGDRTVS